MQYSTLYKMADILSWDNSIDKDVKTIDDKKVGKIRAITKDFIQIEKGTVDKKYYFVPKHYIQGYDGDHIWLAITEDELKQFESERELPLSSFDTPQFRERKSLIENQYPQFATVIPSYTASTASTSDKVGVPWDEVIDKEVKTVDDKDLGKAKMIGADHVEVTEGLLSKRQYYVPKKHVKEFDGKKLHVSLTKDEIKDKFEVDKDGKPVSRRYTPGD
jgi:hypothetical protein